MNPNPLHLSILLTCYLAREGEALPTWETEREATAVLYLQTYGLLLQDFTVTERGNVWVKMLCMTPFPVAHWVDPRTQETVHG